MIIGPLPLESAVKVNAIQCAGVEHRNIHCFHHKLEFLKRKKKKHFLINLGKYTFEINAIFAHASTECIWASEQGQLTA